MPAHLPVISLVAWGLGLVPLLCVAATKAPKAYWWLAGAFAVSFLADASALLTAAPHWVSRVYVVSQAALVGAVFLDRPDALWTLAALVFLGLVGVFLQPAGPELFTHTCAWGLVALLAYEIAPQPLRRSLLVYFGWGLLAWAAYVMVPGWPSWLAYQGTRLVGIALFGYACWKPAPELRLT